MESLFMKTLKILAYSLFNIILGQFVGGGIYLNLISVPIAHLSLDTLYYNWIVYSQYPDLRPQALEFGVFMAVILSFLPWLIIFVRLKFFGKDENNPHVKAGEAGHKT